MLAGVNGASQPGHFGPLPCNMDVYAPSPTLDTEKTREKIGVWNTYFTLRDMSKRHLAATLPAPEYQLITILEAFAIRLLRFHGAKRSILLIVVSV